MHPAVCASSSPVQPGPVLYPYRQAFIDAASEATSVPVVDASFRVSHLACRCQARVRMSADHRVDVTMILKEQQPREESVSLSGAMARQGEKPTSRSATGVSPTTQRRAACGATQCEQANKYLQRQLWLEETAKIK